MACLFGEIVPGKAPYLDRFRIIRQINSRSAAVSPAAYNCRPAKLGVPGGSAYRQCTAGERAFSGFGPGRAPAEICAVVGGKAFDLCVATDNFAKCMGASVARGNRPSCGAGRFCREDFMCQALPDAMPGVTPVVRDQRLLLGHLFCVPDADRWSSRSHKGRALKLRQTTAGPPRPDPGRAWKTSRPATATQRLRDPSCSA